jgi:hypothetical protein
MNARIPLSLTAVGVVAALALFAHANAPAGRYTTANGTVYDTKTKLTWQQAVSSAAYTWADAKTYCSGLSLEGTGWRLPTAKELQTIVDESRSNPAIDPNAFPSTPSVWFWSSTPSAGSSSGAWLVYFLDGNTDYYGVSGPSSVRCVR